MFKAANVGNADRLIRLVAGAALIALPYLTLWALWENPVLRWGAPIAGAILVLTALVRFCPLYRLIGVNTCKAG